MSCAACGAPAARIIRGQCHDCGHRVGWPVEQRPNGFGVL